MLDCLTAAGYLQLSALLKSKMRHALCDVVLWVGSFCAMIRNGERQRFLSFIWPATLPTHTVWSCHGSLCGCSAQIRCPWLSAFFLPWLSETAKDIYIYTCNMYICICMYIQIFIYLNRSNSNDSKQWRTKMTRPTPQTLPQAPRITQLRLGHGKVALQGQERLRRDVIPIRSSYTHTTNVIQWYHTVA